MSDHVFLGRLKAIADRLKAATQLIIALTALIAAITSLVKSLDKRVEQKSYESLAQSIAEMQDQQGVLHDEVLALRVESFEREADGFDTLIDLIPSTTLPASQLLEDAGAPAPATTSTGEPMTATAPTAKVPDAVPPLSLEERKEVKRLIRLPLPKPSFTPPPKWKDIQQKAQEAPMF